MFAYFLFFALFVSSFQNTSGFTAGLLLPEYLCGGYTPKLPAPSFITSIPLFGQTFASQNLQTATLPATGYPDNSGTISNTQFILAGYHATAANNSVIQQYYNQIPFTF